MHVRVSGCELIPERRGRREGGARVGAGISTTARLVCTCMYVHVHVCLSTYNQPLTRLPIFMTQDNHKCFELVCILIVVALEQELSCKPV